jgi:uncharacterized protein YsxB (DUF464 family)
MVKIHFWQEQEKGTIHMKVKGHANTAPYGEDLVCSAATMLVYTVAQAASFMHEQGQLEEKPRVMIRDGKSILVVKPKEEFFAEALHTFWVAQCGAHVLAKNYPDHVALNHLTM